ncbi:MAG: GNAT family N-acetyltransferase [Rhizobiaceae bacterium]
MLTVKIAETTTERDQCYLLRIEVFVRGQNVPMSMELDDHDEADALHFLGTHDGVPVATARILFSDGIAKIQRVAVSETHRGKGCGRSIMQAIIDYVARHRVAGKLVLDAQTRALDFYERLGFSAEGDEFDDAGIPHKRMSRSV